MNRGERLKRQEQRERKRTMARKLRKEPLFLHTGFFSTHLFNKSGQLTITQVKHFLLYKFCAFKRGCEGLLQGAVEGKEMPCFVAGKKRQIQI